MTTPHNAAFTPPTKRVLLLALGLISVAGLAFVGYFYVDNRRHALAETVNIEGALAVAVKQHFREAEALGEAPKLKTINGEQFRIFVAECVERSVVPPSIGLAVVDANHLRRNPIIAIDLTDQRALVFHRADGSAFNYDASVAREAATTVESAAKRIRGGP